MFCYNCGVQMEDGAKFCPKCGTKVPEGGIRQNPQSSDPFAKKKSHKLLIFLCIATAVIAAAVFVIIRFWDGQTDYVATVKAHRPFEKSQGLSYTYGEVLDRYIDSAKWQVSDTSGNTASVNISGKVRGTDVEIAVMITVEQDADDPDLVIIRPGSIEAGGKRYSEKNDEAVAFLLAMFIAYDEGDKDLEGLLAEADSPGKEPLPTEKPAPGDKPLPTEKPAPGDEPLSTEKPAQENTEDLPSGRREYTDEQIYAAYQDILELFYEGFSNQWASYESDHVPAGMELSYLWYQYKEGSLADAGYQFMDLNGDGMPELLISLLSDSWGSGAGVIYDLYSYQNGETIHLFSSGERDRYYLCEDGMIANEGSSGAAISVYTFYRLEDEQLLLQNRVIYDEERDEKNPWFYEMPAGIIRLKEEEALQFIESHKHLPYRLTPFMDYVPEQEPDNSGGQTESDRRILPSEGYAEGGTGDVMVTCFFDYSVNSAYRCSRYADRAAAGGCELLVVEITVKNTCSVEIEMYDADFQIQWGDEADDAYRFPLTAYGEKFPDTVLPDEYVLKPGAERTGLLVFEVPAGYQEFSVSYLEVFNDDSTGDTFFVNFLPGGLTL